MPPGLLLSQTPPCPASSPGGRALCFIPMTPIWGNSLTHPPATSAARSRVTGPHAGVAPGVFSEPQATGEHTVVRTHLVARGLHAWKITWLWVSLQETLVTRQIGKLGCGDPTKKHTQQGACV